MDFGIAKVLQSIAGATTHPIGTLQYMSPEHVDAKPVDARSDLFALGVVLWEMLIGLLIYPAAAVVALGVPVAFLAVELTLLAEQEGVTIWFTLMLSWATGRGACVLLKRLERA